MTTFSQITQSQQQQAAEINGFRSQAKNAQEVFARVIIKTDEFADRHSIINTAVASRGVAGNGVSQKNKMSGMTDELAALRVLFVAAQSALSSINFDD